MEVRLPETSIESWSTAGIQQRVGLGRLGLVVGRREPGRIVGGKKTAGSRHLLAAEQRDMQQQEVQSRRTKVS